MNTSLNKKNIVFS